MPHPDCRVYIPSERRYVSHMSTAEMIYEKSKALPESLRAEALHYVDYLLARREAGAEAAEWAKFSASQLAKQYAPNDAIYDED